MATSVSETESLVSMGSVGMCKQAEYVSVSKWGIFLLFSLGCSGCHMFSIRNHPPVYEPVEPVEVARELEMVTLPEYRIAPPDLLLISALRIVPKPPYVIKLLDPLLISVAGTPFPGEINSTYQVQPDGTVRLGPGYGGVKVAGLTIEQANQEIERHLLSRGLTQPEVSVSLFQAVGLPPINRDYVVGPDGKVNLGVYGKAYVTGMTVDEAREAIVEKLSETLDRPEVSVSVLAYNSKVYYLVLEGAGQGDRLFRLPATGNETVLDAISQVQGLSNVSSKKIWIARPSPHEKGVDQILPVDWVALTRHGDSATNFQVLPGDRVFISEDKLIALDSFISRVTQPIERVFGGVLLGSQTIQTVNRFPQGLRTF